MKQKLLKYIFAGSGVTALAAIATATSCNPKTQTYSVSYGNVQHLTWTSKPTSIAKSKQLVARFSLTTGYAIDEDNSDILVNNQSIKGQDQVLYNNGVVSIPAKYITGNVKINLVTRSSVIEYHTVTLNANGGKFSDGTSTKTINNVYTLTKNLLPDPYHENVSSKTYSFYGWYYEEACTNPVDYGTVLTADTTLYAKWVEETVATGAHTESSNITVDTTVSNIVTVKVGAATNNEESAITLTGNWSNIQFKFIPTVKNATVNVILNNCVIKSNANTCPMLFAISDDELEFKTITITSSGDGINCIYDGRASASTTATDESAGAVTVDAGDLNICGTQVLKINDQNNYPGYEQAIEVDGKLTISQLTMYCYAYDTVARGKKAITISSGNVTCYSMIGDGLKTKNTKLKSGVRNGDITITGSAKVELSTAGDAIDAAHNAIIQSDGVNSPEVSIATGTESNYTNSTKAKAAIDKQDMYLRTTDTYTQEGGYYYSVGFTNDNTIDPLTYEFEEEEIPTIKKIKSSDQPGPGPGPRSNATTYAYYTCDRPYGYKYAYLIKRDTNGTATLASSAFSIPNGAVTQDSSEKNTATFTVSSSSLSVNNYSSWGNYKSLIGSEVVTKSGQTAWGSKGIKADNEITISAGKVIIDCCDDAIKAKAGVVLGTGSNYGYSTGNVTISGGEIDIACADDAIHSDDTLTISGGDITVTAAYEGIEAGVINISGGTTTVLCSDDAMNAAEVGKVTKDNISINVTGGTLDLTAYGHDVDGIDSNNTYTQSGGLVITRGTDGTAFDLDSSGSVTSTGILVCIGKVETTPTSSYNYTLTSSSCSSGSHTITGLISSTISFYNAYSFTGGVKVFTGTKATGTPTLN